MMEILKLKGEIEQTAHEAKSFVEQSADFASAAFQAVAAKSKTSAWAVQSCPQETGRLHAHRGSYYLARVYRIPAIHAICNSNCGLHAPMVALLVGTSGDSRLICCAYPGNWADTRIHQEFHLAIVLLAALGRYCVHHKRMAASTPPDDTRLDLHLDVVCLN